MEQRGLTLAAALDDYAEFAAGQFLGESAEDRAARIEAERNAKAMEEVNKVMRGMSFRG